MHTEVWGEGGGGGSGEGVKPEDTPRVRPSSPLPATLTQGEGITPTPPEAAPKVQPSSPLPATLSQGEGNTSSPPMLWDRSNTEQGQIVGFSKQYRNLLKDKLSELIKNVHFSPLIPHLLQLDVLNRQTRDTIQLNATEATQTLELVEHLERGPCWRLHGFLRALTLTQQPHIVTLLGLNPDHYQDVKTPGHPPRTSEQRKPHSYRHDIESDEVLQISNDLLPGLLQHCGHYNRVLLKTLLFDYDDTKRIDVTPIYIGTDPECKGNQNEYQPVKKMDMFLKLFQRHPPNTVSVEGPAGAGKSAFMQDYAYEWSKDFTACEKRGLGIPCNGHTWKLVLYIPLGKIRGTLQDVFMTNLRCEEHLKERLMDEIETDGKGVLIIGDGIDELWDKESIKSLQHRTQNSQAPEGRPTPKVLITARDGLLSIPRAHFDRELYIKGFSLTQGVAYMAKYFKAMYGISKHPVLEYAQTHQEELGWVLRNPLQVQILSELTAKGKLTLDDIKSLSTVKLFRALDLHVATRDEKCRAAEGNSTDFYKACLRCLLNNERQITEEEVGRGSPYLSLLTKNEYLDQDCEKHHRYGFPHEMVFEYFAMRGFIDYIKSTPSNKKALILYLCSNPNMWNVLRLTCGFLTMDKREVSNDMVVAIIRCCLLLQTGIEPCVKNELTEELPTLPAQIQDSFPRDLLSCGLTTEEMTNMDRMFDLIQDMFTKPDDCLKQHGWAPTTAKYKFWNGYDSFPKFIVSCLEQCTLAERAQIEEKTIHQLLPCAMHDCQIIYDRYVVPVSGRFATTAVRNPNKLAIRIWCLQDLAPTLHSHKQLQQLQQTDERYSHLHTQIRKLNLSRRCTKIHLMVQHTMDDLWGRVEASRWSEEEWQPALKQLLLQYDMSRFTIHLCHQTPLSGLLSACRGAFPRGHRLTRLCIAYGKVPAEDLSQFLDWAHDVELAVHVMGLTIVLPEGCDPGQWWDVHSDIKQKVQREGELWHPTYMSANGQVLCDMKTDGR